MPMRAPTPNAHAAQESPKRVRTCVGCAQATTPDAMVRLVLVPGAAAGGMNVVVDAAGGAFGRGAYLHPTQNCLEKAARGLARSFRAPVHAPADELREAMRAALARRAVGLLGTALRLRKLEIGAEAALAAPTQSLLVVATDAGSIAQSREVAAAVAAGRAVAWSTRKELGELLGREEVALAALTDSRIAAAFASATRTMMGLTSVPRGTQTPPQPAKPDWGPTPAHEGDACKSLEVR